MSRTLDSATLPSALERKLRSIRRRQAVIVVFRATCIAASVLLVTMLACMALDWWLTLFSTSVRTALTAGSLTAAAAAFLAATAGPLVAALRWNQAAAEADDCVPLLQERWRTVASFSEPGRQPADPISQAMLQQVTSEAVALEPLVEPARVARPAVLRPAALSLGVCALVFAAFIALDRGQTSVLLRRFWSPTADITATQVTLVTGDAYVPRGETIELVANLSGVPRSSATMELAASQDFVDVFRLEPEDKDRSTFVHRVAVDESFRYRVLAGDGRSAWHTITAIDYPALEEIHLSVTAPKYVNAPPYEKNVIPSRLRVIQGSLLQLRVKPNHPLTSLELAMLSVGDDATIGKVPDNVLSLKPDGNGWYSFQTQLLEDLAFRLTLHNAHGLTNEDDHHCRVEVIPDKAPVARIVSPTKEMAVAADDEIEIEFEAHDDHGIASAELVIYEEPAKEGEERKILSVQPIPLGDQRLQKHLMGKTKLDLKELNLKPGANISYSIRVTDNRMVQLDPTALAAQDAEAKQPGEQDETSLAKDGSENEPAPAAKDKDATASEGEQHGVEKLLADARIPRRSARTDDDTSADANGKQKSPTASMSTDESTPSSAENEIGKDAANSAQTASDNEPSKQTSDSPDSKDGSNGPGESHAKNDPTREDKAQSSDEANVDPAEMKASVKPSRTGDTSPSSEPSKSDDGPSSGEDPKPGDQQTGEEEGKSQSTAGTVTIASTEPVPAKDAENDQPQGDESDKSDADSATTAQVAKAMPSEAKPGERNEAQASDPPFQLQPQSGQSGQNVETSRRRLKVTERLRAFATTEEPSAPIEIAERVTHIDTLLAAIEAGLRKAVDREIPDADRSRHFQNLDNQVGEVGTYIAQLRSETEDHQFEFVGLQMVHIARTQVTPARDRVFAAIREPLGNDHPEIALQHILRAREMLAGLLQRYQRVARETQLAQSLQEMVKLYEVYVDQSRALMRDSLRSPNPLRRKMAAIDVDQEYLDRFAEVQGLRREMMAELARMLGDDPRLLARYLDLVSRRRSSLRDQLSELASRQEEISTEFAGWRQAEEEVKQDLWTVLLEMRLPVVTNLAKDAAILSERIEQAMPLNLRNDRGFAAICIEQAKKIAQHARAISMEAEKAKQSHEPVSLDLAGKAEQLVRLFVDLEAALDQLNFRNDGIEEVSDFVTSRLLESRTVAEQAQVWARIASGFEHRRYETLAEADQEKLSLATELLRTEMLGIEVDLQGQFQQQAESELPAEIVDIIRNLHRVMEAIVFNQTAATFAASKSRLETAELQQTKALEGFRQAEELFDQIRRQVVSILDEYELDNPNIADLQDPTLDEFLARLEREPGIQAQLGIPNRPTNLRVITETFNEVGDGGISLLNKSSKAAQERGLQAMRMQQKQDQLASKEKPEQELTDAQRQQRAEQQEMQQMLEKALASIQEKLNDPNNTDEQRQQLEQAAENLRRMANTTAGGNNSDEKWDQQVESDKARQVLRALAQGQSLPEQQWNKLVSTLGDGLWQVRGRSVPERYRSAIEQYQDRLRQLMSTE